MDFRIGDSCRVVGSVGSHVLKVELPNIVLGIDAAEA